MGIKPNFNVAQFNKYVDDNIDKLMKAVIRRFKYIAEACIIEARTNKGYQDRTGNLKASIGYVIIKDRKPLYWSDNGGGTEGDEARNNALDDALDNSEIPAEGVCMVMVAGMEYAEYVEALGYNVLTTAEDLAKREVKKAILALQKNIDRTLARRNNARS